MNYSDRHTYTYTNTHTYPVYLSLSLSLSLCVLAHVPVVPAAQRLTQMPSQMRLQKLSYPTQSRPRSPSAVFILTTDVRSSAHSPLKGCSSDVIIVSLSSLAPFPPTVPSLPDSRSLLPVSADDDRSHTVDAEGEGLSNATFRCCRKYENYEATRGNAWCDSVYAFLFTKLTPPITIQSNY